MAEIPPDSGATEDWLQQTRQGDSRAVEELLARYRAYLLQLVGPLGLIVSCLIRLPRLESIYSDNAGFPRLFSSGAAFYWVGVHHQPGLRREPLL
jgi:hypothetical protein